MSWPAIRLWKKLSYSLKYTRCNGLHLTCPRASLLRKGIGRRQFSRTILASKISKDDSADLLKQLKNIKIDQSKVVDGEDHNRSSYDKPTTESFVKSSQTSTDVGETLGPTAERGDEAVKSATSADIDSDSDSSSSSSDDESSSSSDDEERPVDEALVSAAEQVAQAMPGNRAKTKSDLLHRLQEHGSSGRPPKRTDVGADLRSVIEQLNVTQKPRRDDDREGTRGQHQRGERHGQDAGLYRDREQGYRDREQGYRDREQGYRDREQGYRDREQGYRDREPGRRGPGRVRSGMVRQATEHDDQTTERRGSYGKSREFTGSRQPRNRLEKKAAGQNPLDNLQLFSAQPLGIFTVKATDKPEEPDESQVNLYERIMMEQQQASMTYPASNAFQEMSRWTSRGKMWIYPINNEQGMEDEAEVGFHEHVFLERHLADFPKQGPVRHFMELVITGLSKNPYITAAKKQEHIHWYKEYFQDKYAIIDELTISAKAEAAK